jgi:hypothetical protein
MPSPKHPTALIGDSPARLPGALVSSYADLSTQQSTMTTQTRSVSHAIPCIELLEARIAPATFVVTNLDDAGAGSLRDAIIQANAAAGPDKIVFQKDLEGVIALTGQLLITDSVSIKGSGVDKITISGRNAVRLFEITDGSTTSVLKVSLSGLHLTQGSASDGAAIRSSESLTLSDSTVSASTAPAGVGGGISVLAEGSLDLKNSVIAGNSAVNGGGVFFNGEGSVTIRKSVIANNQANVGGGLSLDPGSPQSMVLIDRTTLTGNRALTGDGGGLNLDNLPQTKVLIRQSLIANNEAQNSSATGGGVSSRIGTVTLDRTVISSNSTGGGGGGIASEFSSLTILKSKILGNQAVGGGGGAFFSGGTVKITGSTISANFTERGGGGFVFSSVGLSDSLAIASSVISQNRAEGAPSGGGGGGPLGGGGGLIGGPVSSVFTKVKVLENFTAAAGGGLHFSTGLDVPAKIAGSLIARNSADLGGGGLFAAAGSFEVVKTKILENSAQEGGGIYLFSGALNLPKTLVTKNAATAIGGGLYKNAGSLTLASSKITGNSAPADPNLSVIL